LVWLKGPNGDKGLFRNPESRFGEQDLIVDRVLPDNGEADFLRGIGVNSGGKLPGQVVERRPETADKIASDQCDADIWVGWTKLNDILSTFHIVLSKNAVSVRTSPDFYRFFQGVEMFPCPINLMHYSANW
jgi:hypothetical protein